MGVVKRKRKLMIILLQVKKVEYNNTTFGQIRKHVFIE